MDYEQLSKFLSDELPPEEKEVSLALLEADEGLKEEVARLKNSWAAAQLADAPGDKEIARKGWELFNSRINAGKAGMPKNDNTGKAGMSENDNAGKDSMSENNNRAKTIVWTPWRVAIAAAAVAILVVASYFTGYIAHDKVSVTAYHTLSVPAGQFAQLTLSDGSEIWLNSCSKLVYPEKFTSDTREIRLEGEGLFKVASDRKKPFVVKTGLIDVIATGTQFNVSAYPDDNWIATTLIEGAVKLQSDADSRGYELRPGQIAVYDKQERRISTKNTDTDIQISWIHGEYQFKEMALEDLAKRFERYFNVVIKFEDETLKQRKFTGTFYNSQSIETILRFIETSTQMQYRIINNIIYIK
jgi:ferric-dicitrate binding protein FerR (iron transport regulator)